MYICDDQGCGGASPKERIRLENVIFVVLLFPSLQPRQVGKKSIRRWHTTTLVKYGQNEHFKIRLQH